MASIPTECQQATVCQKTEKITKIYTKLFEHISLIYHPEISFVVIVRFQFNLYCFMFVLEPIRKVNYRFWHCDDRAFLHYITLYLCITVKQSKSSLYILSLRVMMCHSA